MEKPDFFEKFLCDIICSKARNYSYNDPSSLTTCWKKKALTLVKNLPIMLQITKNDAKLNKRKKLLGDVRIGEGL